MKYHIIKDAHDKHRVLNMLVQNFYDDPLYVFIFEDKEKRLQCLNIFFDAYLTYLGESALIYLSEDTWACGIAFDPQKSARGYDAFHLLASFLGQLMKLIPKVGIKRYLRCVKTIHKMSSSWIDTKVHEPYVHLDLMVVHREKRSRGYFKAWLLEMEKLYEGKVLTLETQNPINVVIYGKLGFQVVHEIPLKASHLTQYCMVKKLSNCR